VFHILHISAESMVLTLTSLLLVLLLVTVHGQDEVPVGRMGIKNPGPNDKIWLIQCGHDYGAYQYMYVYTSCHVSFSYNY
jgi:hypothetical protein